MKKRILTLAIIAFMALVISPVYGQEPDKKSEKARENLKEEQKDVVVAKKELKEAQKDSVLEYQTFKKEAEVKIKNNEKCIGDLKTKHSNMNKKDNATYQKKVSEFEQKNENLKKQLAYYKKDEGKDKWASFKNEFNHDANQLGGELKDFSTKNKK